MALVELIFDLPMLGSDFKQREISAGYKFITVMNNSDNKIEVYDEARTDSDPTQAFLVVPSYQAISYPTKNGILYTFYWHDGGSVDSKKAQIIFSETNLNINTPLGGGQATSSVNLITDSVGLARGGQLPAALDGNGRLKVAFPDNTPIVVSNEVEVKNDAGNPVPVTGTVAISTLPAIPTGGNVIGHVIVDTMPAIPTGGNVIGHVIVDTLPAIPTGGNVIGHVIVDTLPTVTRTGSSYNNYTGATSGALLKSGSGVLERVTVNTGAATSTLSLYNALSATSPIAVIDLTSKGSLDYGISFTTGLYTVITGTADVTIIWR